VIPGHEPDERLLDGLTYVRFAERYHWPPEVVERIPADVFDEWWHLVDFLEEVPNERSGRQSPADGGPG
jgi:hypothetical protein